MSASPHPRAPSPQSRRTLLAVMAGAIILVVALAYLDQRRQAARELLDLEQDASRIALSVASELEARLALEHGEGSTALGSRLGSARLESPGEVQVLVRGPGEPALHSVESVQVRSPTIEAALAAGRPSAVLNREEAQLAGLGSRTAVVGLGNAPSTQGNWQVAVVLSAGRLRDREQESWLRLLVSIGVAGSLVGFFGLVALGRLRRELELGYQLELARLASQRDDRLARLGQAARLGTFASGIAHEVSTPLAVIAGRAEQLLPRLGDDPKARQHATTIREQANRIGATIRTFLRLARGGEPVKQTIAPSQLVASAVALVEHRFGAAGVPLRVHCEHDLPAVQGDLSMLEHALVNLLLNACDASSRGTPVEVRVELRQDRVAFQVLDRGQGIPAENAARVEEPFFTTKPEGKGSGLGLAITSEIIKSHRGKLTLLANAPQGVRACMELPGAPSAQRRARQPQEDSELSEGGTGDS